MNITTFAKRLCLLVPLLLSPAAFAAEMMPSPPQLAAKSYVLMDANSGNVLVEKVFAWPGVGSYALEALIASDFAPVQAFVLAMGILYVLLNLLIDTLYTFVDPRVARAV